MTPEGASDHLKRLQVAADRLSLAGAMMGDARTPGAVDGLWWLTLPPVQACLELGISAAEYPKVRRDIEQMAALVENRRAQTGEDIPLTIPRRRTRRLRDLNRGGSIKRIGPLRKAG